MPKKLIPDIGICRGCCCFGQLDAIVAEHYGVDYQHSEYSDEFICLKSNIPFGGKVKIGRIFHPKRKEKIGKFMVNNIFDIPEKCPFLLEHTLSDKNKKDKDICFGSF